MSLRPAQASRLLLAYGLIAAVAILLIVVSAASARAVSPALRSADHVRDRVDRTFVSRIHKQRHCARSMSPRCKAYRRALQRAGRSLARAERRFAHTSVVTQRRGRLHRRQAPPRLRGKRGRLAWSKVADVRSYLVIRKASGMTSRYTVVRRRSLKPPAMPGQRVTYRVRTAVRGSAWSAPLHVRYAPKPRRDRRSSPVVAAAGTTLNWPRVGRVRDYVVVRRIAGREDVYSAVRGTSVSVTPVPGATATYSVRTAVRGSAWSPSVPVSFAAPAPAPVATAAAATAAGGSSSVRAGWKLATEWTFGPSSSLAGLNVYDGFSTSGNNVGGIYKRSNVRPSVGGLRIVGDGVNGGGLNLNDPATYGRWEVRARMEAGSGAAPCLVLWPRSDAWPVDGEIDFMESPFGDHMEVQVTTHWGTDNRQDYAKFPTLDAKQWHTYAVEWEQSAIRYYIDGALVHTTSGTAGREIPNKPMSLAMQVDGPNGWIPQRDASSPAEMAFTVDSVRRYTR